MVSLAVECVKMSSSPDNGNGVMRSKLTLGSVFALISGATVTAGLVALLSWPVMRNAISDFSDEKGLVSREELKILVLDRIGTLATRDQMESLSARLLRVEQRLRELERGR